MADIPAIIQNFSEERLVNRIIMENEKCLRYYLPACSRAAGRKMQDTCQIFDCTGSSVGKLFSRDCMRILKMSTKVS